MIAYVNSGYQVMTTLTIFVNGISTAVLPFESSFTQSGTTYPALTTDQLSKLSSADYDARATAYAAYVTANYQSQYPGLLATAAGSRIQNTTACPLP
jgi:hypothetical protein